MKRFDLLPFALLLPVFGFVALETVRAPRLTSVSQAAELELVRAAAPEIRVVRSGAVEASRESGRDLINTRERIRQGERGTYIGEILRSRDSALARWPDRLAQPIRVWIASGSHLRGWDPVFALRVEDAFEEWSRLGIPIRFTYVVDSADANVHVQWIDRFPEPISGKTLWARDRQWWIVNGNITLALRHNSGDPLDEKAVKAIALHEVGHLLGLDHTADVANIMTPRVRVRDLSDADRGTVRLLYTLPPGPVR